MGRIIGREAGNRGISKLGKSVKIGMGLIKLKIKYFFDGFILTKKKII